MAMRYKLVNGEWVDLWYHPEAEDPIIPLEGEVSDEELLAAAARGGRGGRKSK